MQAQLNLGIGRALVIALIVGVALGYGWALAIFATHGAAHPGLIETVRTDDEVLRLLAELGWTPQTYVALRLALELTWAVTSYVAVGFILSYRRADPYALYLSVALVLVATCGGTGPTVLGSVYPDAAGILDALPALAWCSFLVLTFLFPDGRLVPRWSWVFVAGFVIFVVLCLVPGFLSSFGTLATIWAGLLLIAGAACQVYRFTRVSGVVERQQTKWVLISLGLLLVDLLVVVSMPPGFLVSLQGAEGFLLDLTFSVTGSLLFAFLAVTISFAVVRYRLFAVDYIASRMLVYAILTAFVVAVYVLVVSGVGALLGGTQSPVLPFIATAIVALALLPLHGLVSRGIRRLVFGRRDEQSAVMSRIAPQLAVAVPVRHILEVITASIRSELKLAGVGITLTESEVYSLSGVQGTLVETFPIAYSGASIGDLSVFPRTGEALRAADRVALQEIATQTAITIQAAQSTAEVVESRQRIVTAREEERRRLRNDLHDGIGPTLASLHQRISLAERTIDSDPVDSQRMLAVARSQILMSIDELRTVVNSLRPPALDQLGLVAAVSETWNSQTSPTVLVAVEGDALPPLPAAVEVAVYRIAMEAIANATRHSQGTVCVATLRALDDPKRIELVVSDDGTPLAARADGLGLRSMSERAHELGGTVTVVTSAAGTTVTAVLPYAVSLHKGDSIA